MNTINDIIESSPVADEYEFVPVHDLGESGADESRYWMLRSTFDSDGHDMMLVIYDDVDTVNYEEGSDWGNLVNAVLDAMDDHLAAQGIDHEVRIEAN